MKFTKQSIADLSLPEGKTDGIYFDDDMPGFGLRLRAGGRRVWIAQYRTVGRQRRATLGDARKIDLDAARAAAKRRFAEVTLGGDPQAAKVVAAILAKHTLGALADQYLKAKRPKLRPSTYGADERYLTKHWKPLRGTPVHEIKRRDVAARLREIINAHGATAAARARSALSALFAWAIKEGLADENPVLGTHNPTEGKASRDRVLDDGEIRAIWNACREDDFGRIVRLLILTAARRDEIGCLRWQEIDFERGILSLPGARTKNGKPLCLPLPPMAMEILRSAPRREGREPVFGGKGAGFSAWSYSTLALGARIIEAEGRALAPWRIHDIRRTVATGMAESPKQKGDERERFGLGVKPHVVEAVLNHVSGHKSGVAGVYNLASYQGEVRTALRLWADHVRAIVEGTERKVVPFVMSTGAI
jgi:integrase